MVRIITPEWKIQNARVKWVAGGLNFDDLTEWERDFVEDIEYQSNEGNILTYKQMDRLEKIYREKGR